MPPTRIGPYRILRALGEGGMGAVYEALNESIERRVALKVLHPEYARNPDAVSRFFNEARAVNRIEHPNIVQVSEFSKAEDGTVYLVMEFLRGETLGGRLEALTRSGRRMRPIDAVQIATQLADALTAAHGKGIVHRDLKPGNVMLVSDALSPGGERVKLLDFGIAKLTQEAGGKATKTNALMGTPQYMSPEQCRGAGGVDERTDVYALGVMLYEMLAGQPPFVAEEALGFLAQHAYATPPPLASIVPNAPPEIVALVHRLLEKEKSQRPMMAEVRAELLRLLATLSGTVPVTEATTERRVGVVRATVGALSTLGGSQGQTLQARPLSRKAILAAAILAVLGIAGGARHLLWRSESSPPRTSTAQPTHATPAPSGQALPPVATQPPVPLAPAAQPLTRMEVTPEATPQPAPKPAPSVQATATSSAPSTATRPALPKHPSVAEGSAKRPASPVVPSQPRTNVSPHTAKPATPTAPPAMPKPPRKFVD